jgi:hypothetical protein
MFLLHTRIWEFYFWNKWRDEGVKFLIRVLKRWIKAKLKFEIIKSKSDNSPIQAKASKDRSNNSGGRIKRQQISNIDDRDRVSYDVFENEKKIKAIFNKCFDLIIREINITNNPEYPCRIIFFSNMSDKQAVEQNIMKKLTDPPAACSPNPGSLEYIQGVIGIGNDDVYEDINKAKDAILEGNAVIFVNGVDKVMITGQKGPPSRAVSEPESEKVVRGPREGFVENLSINIPLIRRKIKSSNLKMELFKVGSQTKTDISICYMDNIVDDKIVKEVRKRINDIQIDSVLDSQYITEYIQDQRINIVPTVFRTEKPDVVAGKVLEGRIAILVDGSPIVLTVPTVFPEFMMASEDYYQNFILASVLRWVRYIALYMSLALPGIYVSLITFHSELLPSQLVTTVVKARANVPFNAFVEAVLMILTFTILQEADIRIPKSMGQAVSVVGALVLGEAAVSAGLVGSPMVIVAAFSGIAGLAIPSPELQLSLIHMRFVVLISAGIFGLFGVTCVLLIMFMYLISQRSFGVPYMTPIAPLNSENLGDVFIRVPLWKMRKRPDFITWKDSIRRRERSSPKDNSILAEDVKKDGKRE